MSVVWPTQDHFKYAEWLTDIAGYPIDVPRFANVAEPLKYR